MNRAERYRARREKRLDLHAARGPIRPGDVAATIGLLVLAALVLPVVTTFGGFAAFASDACVTDACAATVATGAWLGLGLPLAIFLAGVVAAIVRLVRHLRGWWFAAAIVVAELLCLPLSWGIAAIGATL